MTFKEIHPFKNSDGKWGYKKGEEILIDAKYYGAKPYNDDICWVKYIGWGAVDIKDNLRIPFCYKWVERIAPNRYKVESFEKQYGVVDNNGNIIIDVQYDSISNLGQNILKLQDEDNTIWMDCDGVLLYNDIINEHIIEIRDYEWVVEIVTQNKTYIKHKKGTLLELEDNLLYVSSNEKYIEVFRDDCEQCLIFSKYGNLIFSREQNNISNSFLRKDYVVIETKMDDSHYSLCFINLETKQEKNVSNTRTVDFVGSDMITVVSSDGFLGLMNSNSDALIPCEYCGVGLNFSNEYVFGSYFDGKNIAATKDGEWCGIIDISQKVVVPYEYRHIENSGISTGGMLLVKKDSLWGVVDLNNEIVIDIKYQKLGNFYGDQAIAKYNNSYGVINSHGEVIIPLRYRKIKDLLNGYYLVTDTFHDFLMDRYGNVTFESGYNTIECNLYDRTIKVEREGRFGFIDVYGGEITPCFFSEYNNKTFINVGMEIPCVIWKTKYYVNVQKLKEKENYAYFMLEDLSQFSVNRCMETGREYFDSGNYDDLDLVTEYDGYHIVGECLDYRYNGERRRDTCCVLNPKGEIIYSIRFYSLSFIKSDDTTITIACEYSSNPKERFELVINRSSQKPQKFISKVEGSNLCIVRSGVTLGGTSYGVADKSGKLLLPVEYKEISIIGDIVYAEKETGCWLLHNAQRIITEIPFNRYNDNNYQSYEIKPIANGYIWFHRQYGSQGPDMIVSQYGNIVITQIASIIKKGNVFLIYTFYDAQYKYLEEYDDEDDRPTKCALYDMYLQQIHPGEYMGYTRWCEDGEVFISVKGNTHIVYDANGQIVFATDEYSDISDFHEGLAVVVKDNNYGVIDIKGNEIIPCEHGYISNFKEGRASTEKYGEKVELYKDGSMQKILYGKVNAFNNNDEEICCHIVDNHLKFIKSDNDITYNLLQSVKSDLTMVSFKDGLYTIINETSCNSDIGKLFFIDKAGLIIDWKPFKPFVRLSNKSVIYGTDSIILQHKYKDSLCPIGDNCLDFKYYCLYLSVDGINGQYISSYNNEVHFIILDDKYAIVNSNADVLWNSHNRMNVFELGNGSFRVYCFSDYDKTVDEKNLNGNDYRSTIEIWNYKNGQLDTVSTSCYIDTNINNIKFSDNSNYMIIPSEHEELHLVVLNKHNRITIDNIFRNARIKSIYGDKLLLEEYFTVIKDTSNDDSEYPEYTEFTQVSGYTLLSLEGGILAKGTDRRYLIIDKNVKNDVIDGTYPEYTLKGVYDLKNDKVLVPPYFEDCQLLIMGVGLYVITEGRAKLYGLYYNSNNVLDCKYKSISQLAICAEKKLDNSSTELSMNTDYIVFEDQSGNKGLVYTGNVILSPERCDIYGVKTVYSDDLHGVSDYCIVSKQGTIDIFHKDKLIRTIESCEVHYLIHMDDICFLRLVQGEKEGLVGENGCFFPLSNRKVKIDVKEKRICVVGNKVYELDGSTIYLGCDNESFVAMNYYYDTCYAFWDNNESKFVLYDSDKAVLNYNVEDHPELGTIAIIDEIPHVVFSFTCRTFLKSPYYEDDEPGDNSWNDLNDNHFDSQEDYEEQTYYGLGGTDYGRWKENGGNLDDMMDGMGF